jgi:hypothetical protein
MSVEMKSWLERLKKFKEKLAQMPDRTIPEFKLLTDKDWLDAIQGVDKMETDDDFAKAWGHLRDIARREFANTVQTAVNAYAQANSGGLPTDFSQLQPYLNKSVDDSILQGYEFTQAGTVTSKSGSLIDNTGNYFYWRMQIDKEGVSSTTDGEDSLHGAIQSYLAANNTSLTDPAQLLPYVNTPEEKNALQKVLQTWKQH